MTNERDDTPGDPPAAPMTWKERLREGGIAFAAYTGLLGAALVGILGFIPWQCHLGGRFTLLSWSHVDWNNHYWNLWEFRRVYLGDPNLFHTAAEFYPVGLDTHTMQGDTLLKLMGGLVGVVASADTVFLLMSLLLLLGNAMGGYVLGRSLTGSRVAGFFLGLLLMFCGAAAWSVNTGNIENGLWLWLCLYLTYFCKVLREGRWQHAVAAAVFAAFAGLSNLTFMHQLIPLSGILLLYHVRSWTWRKIRATGLMCGLIALLMLPLVISFLGERRSNRESYAVGFFLEHEISNIGAMALPMLNSYPPSRYLPWQRVEHGMHLDTHEFNKEDADTYFFMIVLLVFSVMFTLRRSAPWLAAAVLFGSFALGPFYISVASGSPKLYALPFSLAYAYLPLYDHIHFPHRIFNFAVLGGGVAMAFAVERLLRFDRRATVALMAALICIGCGGELLKKWAVRTVPIGQTSAFYDNLRDDPEEFGIVVFPLDFGIIDSRYLYHQNHHRKPLFNGSVPRYFGEDGIPTFHFLKSNAILTRAYVLQQDYLLDRVNLTFVDTPDVWGRLHPHDVEIARAQLVQANLRFVVLQRVVEWEPGLAMVIPPDNTLHDFFASTLGEPVYRDRQLVAFEVRP